MAFLSTLSLRRATQVKQTCQVKISISIHALLAESDQLKPPVQTHRQISIHALLAESDGSPPPCARPTRDFYPRSPCGERPAIDVFLAVWAVISIHALLAESDMIGPPCVKLFNGFLSTLSLRRATIKNTLSNVINRCISIHALLAESDQTRNERINRNIAFLSTLSLRRATSQQPGGTTKTTYFYPRSPCGERLRQHSEPDSGRMNFYPRSPCGERPGVGWF